jgi:hypothetical protein
MLCHGEKNSGAADISPRRFHKGPPAAVMGRAGIRGLLIDCRHLQGRPTPTAANDTSARHCRRTGLTGSPRAPASTRVRWPPVLLVRHLPAPHPGLARGERAARPRADARRPLVGLTPRRARRVAGPRGSTGRSGVDALVLAPSATRPASAGRASRNPADTADQVDSRPLPRPRRGRRTRHTARSWLDRARRRRGDSEGGPAQQMETR